MTKLNETQRAVLASACGSDLGLATRPAGLKSAQVAKMTAALVEARLAKEIRAKAGSPVWRKDEAGQEFALKVLKAGRVVVATVAQAASAAIGSGNTPDKAETSAEAHDPVEIALAPRAPKQSAIVALMQRPGGASIADLIDATGWLPHTTRAALTGLRKKGFAIARSPAKQGGGSVYRIAAAA